MLGCLRRLGARVPVRGSHGDMVAAIRASVVADSADALGLAWRGGSAPVLAWGMGALVLVRGADLADAHGLACQPRRGHGHYALAPRGTLLMWLGGVPGGWVGGRVGGGVVGLTDLLLGSVEAACSGTDDAVHLNEGEHQVWPALLRQGVHVLGRGGVVVVLLD